MRSSIVFFDNIENSRRGTIRGLVVYPLFIVLTLIWFHMFDKETVKNIDTDTVISVMFVGLLIVSALGVHSPNTCKKAVVYSALVGFIVYGTIAAVLLSTPNRRCSGQTTRLKYLKLLGIVVWGVLSTALLGYVLYKVVDKYPEILEYPSFG